ncbi:PPR containing plant-like protein [Medicago truncatula]|uniref:PPR containing plant-like protein n=1 Tax=Medicago truncatula TaxID=3880 RepID=G7KU41_MEDTR|nr:PPR containing plant-like protein [Medicago truncatula]
MQTSFCCQWKKSLTFLILPHKPRPFILQFSSLSFQPSQHTISTILHTLCNSNRFEEAHQRFSLFLSSGSIPDHRTCNLLLAKLLRSKTPFQTWSLVKSLIQIKAGFVPSLVNYNRLMDHFCFIHRPFDAHRLFFDMKNRGHCPNVVSYTTLINGYCSVGGIRDAMKVFDEMLESGLEPNSMTYSVLIRGFLRGRDFESGRELMCKLWERMKMEDELSVNVAAFANLIDSLCKEGFFNEVFEIAELMPCGSSLPEQVVYGQMIDSFCKVGRYHGAARIVYLMRKRRFVPSDVSYNHIIHGLSKDGDCMRGYQLLEEGAEFGFSLCEHTYKVLVEALCRVLDVDKAREVLKLMLYKEGVDKTRIYNIYLRALCHVNNPTELLNVLVFMLESHCQTDVITLNTVINGFCKMGRFDEALKVLNDMLLGKFCAPDVVTFTTLISGLLDAEKVDEALDLFNRVMPENGLKPGVVTYNVLIRCLYKLKRPNDAFEVFNNMAGDGITPDSTTYTVIVEGLCECDQIEEAKSFWQSVIWPSGIHDNFVYAAILKGLCSSGKFNEACHFLYELVDSGISPNIYSYNILINCACNLGLKREVYQIVREMNKNGVAPDCVTWRILHKLQSKVTKHTPFEDPTLSTEGVDMDNKASQNRRKWNYVCTSSEATNSSVVALNWTCICNYSTAKTNRSLTHGNGGKLDTLDHHHSVEGKQKRKRKKKLEHPTRMICIPWHQLESGSLVHEEES